MALFSFLSSSKSESTSSAFSSPIVTKHNTNTNTNTNHNNPAKSIKNSRVDLNEIYRNNRRCYDIESGMRDGRWRMASFRVTVQLAEIIYDKWEKENNINSTGNQNNAENNAENQRININNGRQQFSNYVVGFVMRVGPSSVTLLHALLYILKLRSIYPRARGEPGCAHRLFVVALLVATRYLNDRRVLVKATPTAWSMLSGVFSGPELARMESEFVTFLRGNLFIGMAEVERCIEELLIGDSGDGNFGPIVPGSIDWVELISVKAKKVPNQLDENSIVP